MQAYVTTNDFPVTDDGKGAYIVEYKPLRAGTSNITIAIDDIIIQYAKANYWD